MPEDFPPQTTPGACGECLAEGTVELALRECGIVRSQTV